MFCWQTLLTPAWVQAIGSVVAIFAAIGIASWQSHAAKKIMRQQQCDAIARDDRTRKQEKIDSVIKLAAICKRLQFHVKILLDAIDNIGIDNFYKNPSYSGLNVVNRVFSNIENVLDGLFIKIPEDCVTILENISRANTLTLLGLIVIFKREIDTDGVKDATAEFLIALKKRCDSYKKNEDECHAIIKNLKNQLTAKKVK